MIWRDLTDHAAVLISVKPDQLPTLSYLRLFSESVDIIATVLGSILSASPILSRLEIVLDWAVPGIRKIHKSRTNSPVARRLDPLLVNWMQEVRWRQVHVDIYLLYRKLSLKELQKLFDIMLPETSRRSTFHFGQCHGGSHWWGRCRGS